MQVPEPPAPPPAWYPDPTQPGRLRYWDGSAWAPQVAVPAAEPAGAPQVAVPPAEPGRRLRTTRRNVYGNDMLYVDLEDGTRVGSVNLGTGRVEVRRPELRSELDRAVATWKDEHPHVRADPGGPAPAARAPAPAARAPAPDAPAPGVAEPQPQPPWRDLAANRAGENVRRKAVEVRRKAPVRSFVGRLLGVRTEERDWRVGADGEEEVGRRLARLGGRWKVIHSIVLDDRGWDLDHLVIGPGGVYVLNTKNHLRSRVTVYKWAFYVNGQQTEHLRHSRAEGERASRLLSAACGCPVRADPVLVVMCGDLRIKEEPVGASVVAGREVTRWLERRPEVLDPDLTERIYDVARRESTWRRR